MLIASQTAREKIADIAADQLLGIHPPLPPAGSRNDGQYGIDRTDERLFVDQAFVPLIERLFGYPQALEGPGKEAVALELARAEIIVHAIAHIGEHVGVAGN